MPKHLTLFLLSCLFPFATLLYAHSSAANSPWRDQWSNSVAVALATETGELSPAMLLDGRAGHVFFFNYLTTVFSTLLTNWNAAHEIYLNWLLAWVNWALLMALLARQKGAHWLMLPLAALIFALNQDVNWTTGFMIYSQQANFFFLGALLSLQALPQNPRSFGLAAALTFAGTFSSGYGLVAWLALLPLLWWQNYRRGYLVIWLALLVLSAALYLNFSRVGVSADVALSQEYETIETGELNPLGLLHFALSYLGGSFTFKSLGISTLAGIAGLVLFGLNSGYLYRQKAASLADLSLWAALALYTLGNGGLTALGRLKSYSDLYLRISLSAHYGSVRFLFWAALLALMLKVWQDPKAKMLSHWNSAAMFILAALFLHSNLSYVSLLTLNTGAIIGYQPDKIEGELCLQNYPLQRQMCLDSVGREALGADERILQLAAYRLSHFAELEPAMLLEGDYQPADTLIIDTANPWLNLYVQDWLLAGVAESWQIAPPAQHFPIGDLLPQVYPDLASLLASDFQAEAQTIWFIFTPETAHDEIPLTEFLAEQAYAGTVYPILQPNYRDARFTIIRYQRLPSFLDAPLQTWEVGLELWAQQADLIPCQSVRVESWWRTKTDLPLQYLASARVSAERQILAQADGEIARIPTVFWESEQWYFDSRQIQLPCEMPAANLEWLIYDAATLAPVE